MFVYVKLFCYFIWHHGAGTVAVLDHFYGLDAMRYDEIVMSDRNIRIIDADSSFGGAAGGAGLRVTGALAHPGPPLESPLSRDHGTTYHLPFKFSGHM